MKSNRRSLSYTAFGLISVLSFSAMLGRVAVAAEASPTPERPVVTLTDATRWQPAGGEFRFVITGNPELANACLDWGGATPAAPSSPLAQTCTPLTVRRVAVSTGTPQTVTFAAVLPRDLAPPPNPRPYFAGYGYLSQVSSGVLPAATLQISDVTNKQMASFPVMITSRLYAAFVTTLVVLIAGWMLYRFARYLGVPGPEPRYQHQFRAFIHSAGRGFSIPLRLISTANGWASLSQFQILLWSFVIGAGAVYVMTLTGSLIPISAGTLALLGIAGGATVLSEVKNQQGQTPSGLTPPGPVTLRAVGQPLATEIHVTWMPAPGGSPASAYIVEYEDPAQLGQWRLASSALKTTSLRIVGLSPNPNYRVRVLATNSAGNSADAIIQAPTVGPAQPAASVANLRARVTDITGSSIPLEWDAVADAEYVLQMRRSDSADPFQDVPRNSARDAKERVGNLTPNTRYDFRVRTAAAQNAWSSVVTFTTGQRTPRWSDIVTDTDKPAEIDVTRVQMLFFTAISAFFVAMKIIDTGTIPEIDSTYVALMGISNGVYITTKFVRN